MVSVTYTHYLFYIRLKLWRFSRLFFFSFSFCSAEHHQFAFFSHETDWSQIHVWWGEERRQCFLKWKSEKQGERSIIICCWFQFSNCSSMHIICITANEIRNSWKLKRIWKYWNHVADNKTKESHFRQFQTLERPKIGRLIWKKRRKSKKKTHKDGLEMIDIYILKRGIRKIGISMFGFKAVFSLIFFFVFECVTKRKFIWSMNVKFLLNEKKRVFFLLWTFFTFSENWELFLQEMHRKWPVLYSRFTRNLS